MSGDTTPEQPVFIRRNDHLERLLSDPIIAFDVATAHADAEDMDRAYAMNLAMVRKAAQLTQAEVARKLGVGQAAVSRLEGREDMLLSILYDYLTATGADTASIVVTAPAAGLNSTSRHSASSPRAQPRSAASSGQRISPRRSASTRPWARAIHVPYAMVPSGQPRSFTGTPLR